MAQPVKNEGLWLGLMALLCAGLIWTVHDTLQEPNVSAGDKAPSFEIKDDKGRVYTQSDFGGKVLVLNFWATWCPPCVEETPSLVALSEEVKKDGIIVLGVSIDKNEKAYKRFVDRMRMTYPTVHDREARISASFGTFKFPETYVIKDGKVLEKIISMPEGSWVDPTLVSRLRRYLL
jgi:cytochrome c biogenesis protein CcmG, thiol:disulfide interchange protein DsbE